MIQYSTYLFSSGRPPSQAKKPAKEASKALILKHFFSEKILETLEIMKVGYWRQEGLLIFLGKNKEIALVAALVKSMKLIKQNVFCLEFFQQNSQMITEPIIMHKSKKHHNIYIAHNIPRHTFIPYFPKQSWCSVVTNSIDEY